MYLPEETEFAVTSCKLGCSPSVMILDASVSNLLTDFVKGELIMLLGVRDELQKLQRRMKFIQSLLKDAENRKFDESSIEVWLSQLKDVMCDVEDIIDLCRIEGTQLLANQNPRSKTSPVRAFFLVLDDVWRADVWVDLLRAPSCNSNVNVRVLVTTRDENVATEMGAAYIQHMAHLSEESSWEMLRKRLFSEGEVELANELKELGFTIVRKCGRLPLAIKAISGLLARKERSRKEWEKVLRNDAWSISKLPEGLSTALYLSFEDLPSLQDVTETQFPQDRWRSALLSKFKEENKTPGRSCFVIL